MLVTVPIPMPSDQVRPVQMHLAIYDNPARAFARKAAYREGAQLVAECDVRSPLWTSCAFADFRLAARAVFA